MIRAVIADDSALLRQVLTEALEKSGKINDKTLRESIAYGHVMGSFAVEAFSLDKIAHLKPNEITKRYGEYKKQTCLLCD